MYLLCGTDSLEKIYEENLKIGIQDRIVYDLESIYEALFKVYGRNYPEIYRIFEETPHYILEVDIMQLFSSGNINAIFNMFLEFMKDFPTFIVEFGKELGMDGNESQVEYLMKSDSQERIKKLLASPSYNKKIFDMVNFLPHTIYGLETLKEHKKIRIRFNKDFYFFFTEDETTNNQESVA